MPTSTSPQQPTKGEAQQGTKFASKMLSSTYFSDTSFALLTPLAVVYSLAAHLWAFARGYPSVTPLPRADNDTTLKDRVAIVTGANTGIGFETAKTLAVRYGMTVVLACRSRDKGEQAARQIQREGTGGRNAAVFLEPLDLSSSQSITEFAKAIRERFDVVDVLVNNAGRNSSGDPVEGRDLLFQTNFLGHFHLTAQLMDAFAPRARVVNLSSVMHHFIDGDDVDRVAYWEDCVAHDRPPASTYQESKLAAILFSMELNRRYPQRIQAVAVNPGGVNSDIWRDFPRLVIPLFALVYLDKQQGSRTSVAGAVCDFEQLRLEPNSVVAYLQPYHQYTSSSLETPIFPLFEMLGVFGGHARARPRLPAHDGGVQAARALWQASVEATDSHWPEPMCKET